MKKLNPYAQKRIAEIRQKKGQAARKEYKKSEPVEFMDWLRNFFERHKDQQNRG